MNAPEKLPSVLCDARECDARALRSLLGQYATGVTVITTRAADGRKVGMTANSFSSVSLEPPLILWSLARSAPSLPDFQAASHFGGKHVAGDTDHVQFARGLVENLLRNDSFVRAGKHGRDGASIAGGRQDRKSVV